MLLQLALASVKVTGLLLLQDCLALVLWLAESSSRCFLQEPCPWVGTSAQPLHPCAGWASWVVLVPVLGCASGHPSWPSQHASPQAHAGPAAEYTRWGVACCHTVGK